MTAELKGACPAAALDRFLAAIGWPETPVILQLVQESIYLDEASFRRWATRVGAIW
jgi:hypothetical protein